MSATLGLSCTLVKFFKRYYLATGSSCKRTIIVSVNENGHVKNLLKSTWGEAVHGWKIGVKNQMWQDQMLHLPQSVIVKCGGQHSWYGWNDHDEVGTISTTLKANNLPIPTYGRLDFGNCWSNGVVKVYLDDKLIGEARANTPSKIIEFPMPNHDSTLKLRDEGEDSKIRFNNFQELYNCSKNFTPHSEPETQGN